ncbi:hypothetical protein A5730_14660 [Mycobacterium sp. ACS4054]|nr:hypothetical protein A5730_14660 [Mycobacterium sp. ACS4054]
MKWFNDTLRPYQNRQINEQKLLEIAGFMRAEVEPDWRIETVLQHLMGVAQQDGDYFLDLIDGTLQYVGSKYNAPRLKALLDAGGSVWTVSEDHKSLVKVVGDESQATYDAATIVADEATTELREAWTNAFGRNGDPSDAWDHAIKAVEDVLIPEMMPNNTSATLGNVVGELAGQNGAQWRLVLPGNNQDHDVAHLVAMLRLIWPNHDRHGGSTPKRTPLEPEARAVVTLAATIVQWHREGWVVQKR